MAAKDRLYDAFGELIYAVALADGIIQPEETQKLEELLQSHSWGKQIKWSFDYEAKKSHELKEAYEKALITFKNHGPDPDYAFLIDLLEQVAKASGGVERSERQLIDGFQETLREHFLKYLDKYNLRVD